MNYKNETEENIKYRIGDYDTGFEWYTIRPGEVADIPLKSARSLQLTKVELESQVVEDETKQASEDPEDVGAVFPEDEEDFNLETYRKKLIDIKGVGPKSAEEIIEKYATEEILKQAVADGEEVHNHDGIDKAVKEEFA